MDRSAGDGSAPAGGWIADACDRSDPAGCCRVRPDPYNMAAILCGYRHRASHRRRVVLSVASGDRAAVHSPPACVELRDIRRRGRVAPPDVACADEAGDGLPFCEPFVAVDPGDGGPLDAMDSVAGRLAELAVRAAVGGDGARGCARRTW